MKNKVSCFSQNTVCAQCKLAVIPPLWSRLRYLNNYWIDFRGKFLQDIHVAKKMNPIDFFDPLTFGLAPPAG